MSPKDDHHDLHSPELARLVLQARAALPRPSRVDFAAIHAGAEALRRTRRRRITAGVGLALAAGLAALVIVQVNPGQAVFDAPDVAAVQATATTSPATSTAITPTPGVPTITTAKAPVLAAGIRVKTLADADTQPKVLGPWTLGLGPGHYDIEVDEHPGPELLRARSAGGTVELRYGRVEIVVGADSSSAQLRHGVATWIAPDGLRSPMQADLEASAPPLDPPAPPPEQPDVRALARRADAMIAAGRREPAIKLLTQILEQYPNYPAARSALLDLAPLLRAAGRTDEARCAYQLYLERYPAKAQLATEVTRALERLGDGPACRGLHPR